MTSQVQNDIWNEGITPIVEADDFWGKLDMNDDENEAEEMFNLCEDVDLQRLLSTRSSDVNADWRESLNFEGVSLHSTRIDQNTPTVSSSAPCVADVTCHEQDFYGPKARQAERKLASWPSLQLDSQVSDLLHFIYLGYVKLLKRDSCSCYHVAKNKSILFLFVVRISYS